MLRLPQNSEIKTTFDTTRSLHVSTQKLNEKGVAGNAVDIWTNVSSGTPISPKASVILDDHDIKVEAFPVNPEHVTNINGEADHEISHSSEMNATHQTKGVEDM